MRKAFRLPALLSAIAVGVLGTAGLAVAHPELHGTNDGHLLGSGADGNLKLIGTAQVTSTDDLVADVAVSPTGNYAYLANWGKADCNANSEAGGVNDPDAGAWVVDISNPRDPKNVTFIPHSQDSRPGEGMHALNVSTKFFTGEMLVMNNEQCGKNGKGGVSLVDVSNPAKPYKLSEHFGDRGFADTNDIHASFAWDAGDKAYVVMTDNFEATDVDILDITNPKRPRLIADMNVNAISRSLGNPVAQPNLGLSESSLHDMIVKQIDGRWKLLLSYWDGGYVTFDVTDPTAPVFEGDTDYSNPDPELLESTGKSLPPEGNGHQAEYTADNRFFIGTDEDFSPYKAVFKASPGTANERFYEAGEFGFTPPIKTFRADGKVNGPTVFGGYGCPDDRGSIPPASSVEAGPDEEKIVVFQRGPVGDPNHSHGACFFSEKIESGQMAGYDAVVIANHHSGAGGGEFADAAFCGGQGHTYTKTAPAACIGHRGMHELFGDAPDYSSSHASEPALGTRGEKIEIGTEFDGWGYVHLFERGSNRALDTYAIDEAHQESKASGFGDLTVHEVATSPQHADRAYLSYYSGGIRALQIQCSDPADNSTCELVETGKYLGPTGNDFWGVEAFEKNGTTYVLGSDRDHGLFVFEDTASHDHDAH